jgi:hypothetical protein
VIHRREWGEVNQTEITMPDGSKALGLSTNEGVRFQGWHARPGSFLLVILDEAPGVRPDIYEAVEGISAGGDVRLLLLGNPTTAAGPFYDVFAAESVAWQRYTIDAFASPNLAGVTLDGLLAMGPDERALSARPYLVTRQWVYDRYHEWGADHPLWAARVRGQFPDQAEDALVAGSWIDAAATRARLGDRRSTDHAVPGITAGIDVAGPGEDETVVCLARGSDLLHMQAWPDRDPRAAVLSVLRSWAGRGLRTVNVDAVGIGYYFYLELRDELRPLGVVVHPVNVGESSTTLDQMGHKKFANLKADVYWHMRERFEQGDVSGLAWPKAREQLRWLRYATPRGVITVESKDDLRKRLGTDYSPDWAEALALALWPGQPDITKLYGSRPVSLGSRARPRQVSKTW